MQLSKLSQLCGCKQVATVPPNRAGLFFCNYKVYNSQVLKVTLDLNYELIHLYFGANDHVSDGGILEYTNFCKLESRCLKIPESSDVKGKSMPYGFNGDQAFTLRKDFPKSCNAKQLIRERKIVNYRHCHP